MHGMAKSDDAGSALRRLGGGRWQSKDGRFTIEPQSGTWVVVDAEQTDELGLPRVRGPYPSLRAARAAIEDVGTAAAEASPLAERLAARPRPATGETKPGSKAKRAGTKATEPEPPAEPEPAWLAELPETRRDGVRRLIRDLEAADLPDPIGLARRDVVDDEPAVARAILVRRVASAVLDRTPKASAGSADEAAALAAEILTWVTARSRDPDVAMRLPGWRLVEDDDTGRRIELSRRDLGAEIERLERRKS
jgi:hypothetical protein